MCVLVCVGGWFSALLSNPVAHSVGGWLHGERKGKKKMRGRAREADVGGEAGLPQNHE